MSELKVVLGRLSQVLKSLPRDAGSHSDSFSVCLFLKGKGEGISISYIVIVTNPCEDSP